MHMLGLTIMGNYMYYLLCEKGHYITVVIESCQMQCSVAIVFWQVDVLGEPGDKLLHTTGEKYRRIVIEEYDTCIAMEVARIRTVTASKNIVLQCGKGVLVYGYLICYNFMPLGVNIRIILVMYMTFYDLTPSAHTIMQYLLSTYNVKPFIAAR